MSYINQFYFVGTNSVPNTDRVSVSSKLESFINDKEPELLRDLLGNTLYKAMKYNGSEQRFIDLLYGCEYLDTDGEEARWAGLLTPPDVTYTVTPQDVVAGFIPVPVTMEFYDNLFLFIDNTTVAVPFQRTSAAAVSIDDLVDGVKYSFRVRARSSMIANYVFFHYLSDSITQTVGLGEVVTKAEGADVVSPIVKQTRVWNEMIGRIWELRKFLYANASVYPEWSTGLLTALKPNRFNSWSRFRYWYAAYEKKYTTINQFNL